ncbi:MAG: histidine kinase dimerization/phosphoacceptor domain -containing protein [Ferruginibacter sp.]
MRKFFFFFIINVCCLHVHLFSQTQTKQLSDSSRADSLLLILPKSKSDSDKVKILNEISNAYRKINPAEGIKKGNEALELAQKINWTKGIAYAYATIAESYDRGLSDYPTALDYYLKGLKIFESVKDKAGFAKVYGAMGAIYRLQKDTAKSMYYMKRSLELSEELNDKKRIAVNLGNIGALYCDKGDNKTGLEYIFRAAKMNEETGDRTDMARNLANIGTIYSTMNNISQSLEYIIKALRISEETDDKPNTANYLARIGDVYYYLAVDSGDSPSAKKIVEFYAGKNTTALQQAKMYTDSAIAIEITMTNYNSLYVDYYQLSDIQATMGDYKGALKSFQDCFNAKEKVFNIQKDKKLTQAAMQYEFDKKEAAAKAEQERKNLVTYIISIVLLFVLIIALVTFRSLRRNQKQKRIISEQKEKVEQQNKEKETLLKEIHHRVKNNLQVISSLLELQSGGVEDENAKAALTEGQNRVKSIALIHQKLYQHENLAAIELNNFVNELYRQVASVFIKKGQTIETNFSVPETLIDIDTAVPFGLILNELLTNSFKYAFDIDKKNELKIDLSTLSTGKYIMTYSDNGNGLPAGTDLNKSKSLGLRLINRLSKQIGGIANYSFDKGSVFTINFTNTETRING